MFACRRSVCFAVLIVACGLEPVAARDLFVDNLGGSDRADGRAPQSTSEGGPVQTITRALALAEPGDQIHVANTGTPYREMISLSGGDHSGFAVTPFTIFGNGAVLDGSQPVPSGAWEDVRRGLFRFRPPRGSHHRLFIDGRPAVRRPIDAEQNRLPALAAGEWCSHDGYIYFATDEGKLPREYQLSYAALPVGVTLYHVKNVVVLDLVVQGFHTDGVNAHDSARNVRLGGMILRGNGRSGLAAGGSSQVEADGCLIGDNGTAQVSLSQYATLSLKNCDVLDAAAPAMSRTGGRLFVNGEQKP